VTIRKLTSPIARPVFATYDFEWRPYTLDFRLAGFFDGSRYWHFETIPEFLAHVLSDDYRGWWFFAHFGGAADFNFLIDHLRRLGGYQIEARFSGSAAVFVEVSKNENEKWIFVDSFFLLRDRLRRIAEKLGMKKGGSDDDLEIFNASMAELISYNEGDCRILYKAVERFADLIYQAGGELKPTTASCALALWKRRYLRAPIRTNHLLNVRLREAYIASRVEPFRVHGPVDGGEWLYQYDINSSFPYSMTFEHPGSFIGTADRVKDSDDCFFVDCEVEIFPQHVPPIPMRLGGKIFFPFGRFARTWMTGVDFRLAEAQGRILRVHEVMLYDRRTDLRAYIEDIYARRLASTGFDKDFWKLMMNGLYGKTGEQTLKSSIILNPRDRSILSRTNPDGSAVATEIFPGCLRVEEEKEIPHEHVPIAAHVTALSRKWITLPLQADGRPYYVDTDCIVTECSTLPTGKALGALKLEARAREGYFYAPKFYYLEDVTFEDGHHDAAKVKAKGFSGITLDGFRFLVSGKLSDDAHFGERDAKPVLLKPARDGASPVPALVVERMGRPKELIGRFARQVLRWEQGIEKAAPSGIQPTSQLIPKAVRLETPKRRFHDDGSSEPFDVAELQAIYGR